MSDAVKPRAARTRATRRRIVDAATELFVAEGYGATTLEQIAARAGVAVQTVYFHFGNKRTVLKEAVDVAAVGVDQEDLLAILFGGAVIVWAPASSDTLLPLLRRPLSA